MSTQYKPQRGLGDAVNRARRRMAANERNAAERREQAVKDNARYEIERLRQRSKDSVVELRRRRVTSVINSAVGQSTAVLRSMGRTNRIESVNGYTQVNAWTDFNKIFVEWPLHQLISDLQLADDLIKERRVLTEIFLGSKGVLYHEIGHLEYTIPLKALADRYNNLGDDPNRPWFSLTTTIQRAWNILEDQRMEAAVIDAAPVKAGYFANMFATYLLAHPGHEGAVYMLMPGRSYLPVAIRDHYRKAFTAMTETMFTPVSADEVDAIVADYMAATTVEGMVDAVVRMDDVLRRLPQTPPQSSRHGSPSTASMSPEDVDDKASKGATQQEQQQDGDESDDASGDEQAGASDSKGDNDSQGDADTEGQGSGEADDDSGESDNSGESDDSGESAGEANDESGNEGETKDADSQQESNSYGQHEGNAAPSVQDQLRQMVEDTFDALVESDDGVASAMGEALAQAADGTLPDFHGDDATEMTVEDIEAANAITVGIEQALQEFVTESAPRWISNTEDGVLVPLDYRTRSAGDWDYFTDMSGTGTTGLDLHVSFLADVSMSMSGSPVIALSRSMYAFRRACDNLGIDSTFVLWSSGDDYYRIWEDGNVEPIVVPVFGGTSPVPALDDALTHNENGAARHLIVVFTDGEMSEDNLMKWGGDERSVALLTYGSHRTEQIQADVKAGISEVGQIPEVMTQMVRDLLRA